MRNREEFTIQFSTGSVRGRESQYKTADQESDQAHYVGSQNKSWVKISSPSVMDLEFLGALISGCAHIPDFRALTSPAASLHLEHVRYPPGTLAVPCANIPNFTAEDIEAQGAEVTYPTSQGSLRFESRAIQLPHLCSFHYTYKQENWQKLPKEESTRIPHLFLIKPLKIRNRGFFLCKRRKKLISWEEDI